MGKIAVVLVILAIISAVSAQLSRDQILRLVQAGIPKTIARQRFQLGQRRFPFDQSRPPFDPSRPQTFQNRPTQRRQPPNVPINRNQFQTQRDFNIFEGQNIFGLRGNPNGRVLVQRPNQSNVRNNFNPFVNGRSNPRSQRLPTRLIPDNGLPSRLIPNTGLQSRVIPDTGLPSRLIPDTGLPPQLIPVTRPPTQLIPVTRPPTQLIPVTRPPTQLIPVTRLPTQLFPVTPPTNVVPVTLTPQKTLSDLSSPASLTCPDVTDFSAKYEISSNSEGYPL